MAFYRQLSYSTVKKNPFLSDTYKSVWFKHFNDGVPGIVVDGLEGPEFVKHEIPNVLVNAGTTHTKGISYTISDSGISLGNKVLLIYDVPDFTIPDKPLPMALGRYRIKQYPGYRIDLYPYENYRDFLLAVFNHKSRYKIKSYKRKLEEVHDISYENYFGDISRADYDRIFDQLYVMLTKRFEEKRESNNNLKSDEWSFYRDAVYPMILEKRASLHVIWNKSDTIGILLNYLSEDAVLGAIMAFDINFSKFNVGTVNLLNLLEWSFARDFRFVDFSKGHYDYKTRWGSERYEFEYHLLFNRRSVISRITALTIKNLYWFKQYLRSKGLNERFHKLMYALRR